MMLDFIVTHYNEDFSVGKPFFDMLAMQKGVDFSQIRVLLIHDGSRFFPEKTFSGYPYKVEQYRIQHSGVSAARNKGMDLADAKWICFCDFDDCYCDIYALKLVLDSLTVVNYDFLWNPIYMEDMNEGKFKLYPMTKFNMIFIHNKYIRLEFLRKTELRFNEQLCYSEDSAFLAILNIMLDKDRIGEIRTPMPLYTWAYRPGSCTSDRKNVERNVEHLFNANRYIAEEFERLKYPDASLMKFRAITDAYFALTSLDAPACEDLKPRVLQYWNETKAEIRRCDPEDIRQVYESSKRNSRRKANPNRPSLPQWLAGLGDQPKGREVVQE